MQKKKTLFYNDFLKRILYDKRKSFWHDKQFNNIIYYCVIELFFISKVRLNGRGEPCYPTYKCM